MKFCEHGRTFRKKINIESFKCYVLKCLQMNLKGLTCASSLPKLPKTWSLKDQGSSIFVFINLKLNAPSKRR